MRESSLWKTENIGGIIDQVPQKMITKQKKLKSNLQVTQNPPANLFMLLNHDKNLNPFSTALVYTVHGF